MTWKFSTCAASLLALAASCATDLELDVEPEDTATSTSALTGSGLAYDEAAVAMLNTTRAIAYADLASRSSVPPQLVVDTSTAAVTAIGLDLAPLGTTPVETAWQVVKRWQPLFDDRVLWTEYRLARSRIAGCDGAVITFDRYVGGYQVIGSRLTLHFDGRGHLIFVTNGVAPVKAKLRTVDPTKLPGAKSLAKLVGPKNDLKRLRRTPVLAPLPDGSGLHAADLVSFFDPYGKRVAALAVGDTAITDVMTPAGDDHPWTTVKPDVRFSAGDAVPSYVSYQRVGGLPIQGLPIERNPVELAYRYLETHATVFHTGEARCQFVPRMIRDSAGDVHVRLAQRHGTLPIFGGELGFTFDGTRLQSVLGHTIGNLVIPLTPSLDEAAAIARADQTLDDGMEKTPDWQGVIEQSLKEPAVAELGVLPRYLVNDQKPIDRLVWRVRQGAFTLYVDAIDGAIRGGESWIQGAAVVNDAGGRSELESVIPGYTRESVDGVHVPGAPLNTDTNPARVGGNTSSSLIQIRDTLRALGWRGQNGHGSDFIVNTNVNLVVNTGCQNAFADPILTHSVYMCLGTGTTDILAHEITHGVMYAATGLTPVNETGAINEAFADTIGNTIFRDVGGTWLQGENDTVAGSPVRDMAAAANIAGYRHRDTACNALPWSCDSGYVHANSAIISRAHVNIAQGVSGSTPLGPNKLLKLAFETMTTRLPSSARMDDVLVAELDVCQRFVARGTRDLAGVAFSAADCNQLETAFADVGLRLDLVSSWSEPALGFEGTDTWYQGERLSPAEGCQIQNVEAHLIQLWDDQTVDLDPTTPLPSRVNWNELSSLEIIGGPGSPPAPINTPSKQFDVHWTAIYGVKPSYYPRLIPATSCPAPVHDTEYSAVFEEGNAFGGSGDMTLGPADVTIDDACTLDSVALELLDGNDQRYPGSTTHPHHTITHWILFVPANFNVDAFITRRPAMGVSHTHVDLSGDFHYSYDVGRTLRARWRYTFSRPATMTTACIR